LRRSTGTGPGKLDELYKANDVEVRPSGNPSETSNLAADRQKNADLIGTMNGKLEAVVFHFPADVFQACPVM
jgi:hypothetical protein